ncbi:urease accessory protein UreE [Acerihabitans arboris]|uniref:Urease accessory protein UreE n=1 Tax=Acerihabitans arboris TaxID=2691583 RepID=A0A845SQI9_9GAMM|nr:urease accessory protein UreE [Acerihabitans arboris]NDL65387.1 urease accessory protein UreE [Acerihabitans arboris]
MIVLTKHLDQAPEVTATVTLDLDTRIKSRAQVRLDDGREAGLLLPRGQVIRGGDVLCTEDGGEVVRVIAAPETVSTVYARDALLLARICYHLGNRHVPLQIEREWVRYQPDHVLDAMVMGLGAAVRTEQAAFEPEAGAYQSAPHGHHHPH